MPPRSSRILRLRPLLEENYTRFNRAQYIYPDPLAPVRAYPDPRDQELAGLIAASLAFGNVKQILRSVDTVLALFPAPRAALLAASPAEIQERLHTFRHRYTTGEDMADLLCGAQRMLREYGSLERCFQAHLQPEHETVLPALTGFVRELRRNSPRPKNYLIAEPDRGSACKRWFMYLRWMVRRDQVDPGAWAGISPALLLVPMDTHMHRISRAIGLTRRKQANLKTALEVTAAFRKIAPGDPAKFDFSLTRLGIRDDITPDAFISACRATRARPALRT